MPRATSPSNKGDHQPTKDKASTDPESEEDDDEAEEEYEIEAIIDAKRGVFGEGRIGYFVKWKNYDSKDNSWVDEKDIGNAGELVHEFWKKHPKKQVNIEGKKKSRQSTGGAAVSEAGRKRGRKSLAKEGSDGEEAPIPSRSAKKAKKQTNNGVSGRTESPEIGAEEVSPMQNYAHLTNWEGIVKSIDTVERTQDGKLFVYFTLHDETQVKETSEVCKSRFPAKLIEFYESNLRWKSADD